MLPLEAGADYRAILRKEFHARWERTQALASGPGRAASYSLRTFARELGLAPSRLSEILSGKQGLSAESAKRIAVRLGMQGRDVEIFCDLVESRDGRAQVKRELAKARLEKHRADTAYYVLQADAIQVVSEWYHFAILQFLGLDGFSEGSTRLATKLARRLGLPRKLIQEALQRLIRMGLIGEVEGRLKPLKPYTATSDGVPSAAIRRLHRQLLLKALRALEEQAVEERDFSALVLPVDRAQLPEAKRWLRLFRRRFTSRLNRDEKADEVYCLSMQFFRLGAKNGA